MTRLVSERTRRKKGRLACKPRKLLFPQYEFDKPAQPRDQKVLRYRRSPNSRLKEIKTLLRLLSRLGQKCKVPRMHSQDIRTRHEPIKLGQRVILQRRNQPVKKLKALHKLHQGAEVLATEELELATAGINPFSKFSLLIRLGIQERFQEWVTSLP